MTLRAVGELPSLRGDVVFASLADALGKSSGSMFRVLHYSAQSDHIHLIVEADDARALSRGVQGLAIRCARAINRALRRRGRVWGDRFHARALATPHEVRNALAYVLNNVKKHCPRVRGLDPYSSAPWFSGWKGAIPPTRGPAPLPPARSWLARVGWSRHGRIGIDELPGRKRRLAATARHRIAHEHALPPDR